MIDEPNHPDPLDALLAAMFDPGLEPGQWEELRARLESDPRARQRYSSHVRIHALLETELTWPALGQSTDFDRIAPLREGAIPSEPLLKIDGSPVTSDPVASDDEVLAPLQIDHANRSEQADQADAERKRPRWRIVSWLASAAAILIVCLVLISVLKTTPPGSVATLTEASSDVRWEDDSLRPDGSRLVMKPLSLMAGEARVTFNGGAVVTVRGPARFKPTSGGSMTLDSGTISAVVPEAARGFAVQTPVAKLIDLGTEFGISVGPHGQTDLHVLEGRMSVAPTGKPEVIVGAGSAMRVDAAQAASIPFEARQFEFAARSDDPSGYARWMAHGRAIRADPSLLAYYTFERDADRPSRLGNLAPTGASADGQIVGPKWAEGRFPGKTSLHFSGGRDKVAITVPGQSSAVTIWLWVRLEYLPSQYSALLDSDLYPDAGGVHWNLLSDGAMEINVDAPVVSPAHAKVITPQPVLKPRSPKWTMLASVYTEDGLVLHYADGQAIGQPTQRRATKISLGRAQIGNWSGQIRGFYGWFDEMGIMGRAMTPQQIQEMYSAGRPRD